MPFPSALFSSQLTALRGTQYRAPLSLAYVPQTAVFVAQVISGVAQGIFAQLDYDNVTTGSFGAILPGMTVYLSASNNIRAAYAIGRARISADSTYVYIGELAVVVQPDDYIIVVNDYWVQEKLGRIGNDGVIYVDWSLTYANMQPLIGGLQSGYVNDVASGAASFSFAPIGQAMALSATPSTWLWSVGDGTITTGTTSTQNVTVSFPQGFRWVRVTLTDSNGISNFFTFPVWVGTTYIIPNIEAPSITGTPDDGYNATINAWDFQGTNILRSLPDNTYVCIFSNDFYGATTTPILTNVDYVGRLRQENSATRGDETFSVVQDGSFQIEGFGAQLNRLSAPQLSITHSTSPAVWGQINQPTPPRMISHLSTRYNTLSNVCSLLFQAPFTYRGTTTNANATVTVGLTNWLVVGMAVAGTGIPVGATIATIASATTFTLSANATATGGTTLTFTPLTDDNAYVSQAVSMTETSAGASMAQVAMFINAQVCHAPSGEIMVQRQAIYQDNGARSDLTTITNITTADMLSFVIDRDYVQTVGRVFAGAERFNTTINDTDIFTASAPPVARGNGEGIAQQDGQVLIANQTDSDANTDLAVRTAALYAASQPTDKLDVTVWDGWRNVLVATCWQWWTFTIAATDNERGLVYTSSQRWILSSTSQEIDIASGTRVVKATFFREPAEAAAQVQSSIVPDLIPPYLPVLDVLPPYPAFPPDALINYPTDTPGTGELQMNAGSAFAGFSPLPSDQAQEAADSYAPPNCEALNVFFSNSANTTTVMTLGLGDLYLITVKGDAQLAADEWQYIFNFVGGDADGWAARTIGLGFGATIDADGWNQIDSTSGWQNHRAVSIGRDIPISTTITEISVLFDFVKGTYVDTSFGAYDIGEYDPIVSLEFVPFTATVTGNDQTLTWTGALTTDKNISVFIRSARYGGAPNGDVLVKQVTMRGTGTNPFTGIPGTLVRGDAFYQGYNAGEPSAYPPTQGLFLNNAAVATIPPYSTNHEYVILYTGGGNPLLMRFEDGDYSDNQNVPMRVLVCPV
jgi:hypothetical protein